jgi:phosphatidylinositol glycan class N
MFWEEIFARRQALAEGKRKLFDHAGSSGALKLGLNFALYIGILEVMVSLTIHVNVRYSY